MNAYETIYQILEALLHDFFDSSHLIFLKFFDAQEKTAKNHGCRLSSS